MPSSICSFSCGLLDYFESTDRTVSPCLQPSSGFQMLAGHPRSLAGRDELIGFSPSSPSSSPVTMNHVDPHLKCLHFPFPRVLATLFPLPVTLLRFLPLPYGIPPTPSESSRPRFCTETLPGIKPTFNAFSCLQEKSVPDPQPERDHCGLQTLPCPSAPTLCCEPF